MMHRRNHAPANNAPTHNAQAATPAPAPAPIARPGRTLLQPGVTPREFLTLLVTPAFIARLTLTFIVLTLLVVPLQFVFHDIGVVHSPPAPSLDVFCSSPLYAIESLPALPAGQDRCYPCPAHATCRYGKVECHENYFQVWHECVARAAHTQNGLAMKERLIHELESHAGRRLCGDSTTPGAQSPDLTAQELQEYVRPFHPTSDQLLEFDRAWSFATLWLNAEGVLLQTHRPENVQTRLLVVNVDSRQPLRYRARYPLKTTMCRMKEATDQNWVKIILIGLAATATIYAILAILFVRRVFDLSASMSGSLISRIRDDYFLDSDHGGRLTHPPHSVLALQSEFLPNSRSSHDALLYRLVWSRVQSTIARNTNVEVGEHTFQYGPPTASFRWIGPTNHMNNGNGHAQTDENNRRHQF